MDSFGELGKHLLVQKEIELRAELEAEVLAGIKEEEDQSRSNARIRAEWNRLNVDRIVANVAKAVWGLTGVLGTRSDDFSGTPVLIKEVVTPVPSQFSIVRVTLFSITLFEDGIQILTRPGTLPFTSISDIPAPQIVAVPLSEVQSSKALREKLEHLLSSQIRARRPAVDWRAREQRNTKGDGEIVYPPSKPLRPERGIPGLTVNNLIREAVARRSSFRKRLPWGRHRL